MVANGGRILPATTERSGGRTQGPAGHEFLRPSVRRPDAHTHAQDDRVYASGEFSSE